MEENDYISLVEATKYCEYSQEYLSLRARQGKLKAVKRGRNWFTTKQWLNEYTSNFDDYLSARRSGLYRISRKQTRRPAQGKIDSLAIKRRFVIALAGIGLLAFATGGFTAIHLSDIIFQKHILWKHFYGFGIDKHFFVNILSKIVNIYVNFDAGTLK